MEVRVGAEVGVGTGEVGFGLVGDTMDGVGVGDGVMGGGLPVAETDGDGHGGNPPVAVNGVASATAAPELASPTDGCGGAAPLSTPPASAADFPGGPPGPFVGSLDMRVTHSLLHAEDLAQLVEREYAIAAPVKVNLLNRGFNDTYLVTDAEGGRRVLRVYNREKYWIRSESDLRFELDLLEHLAAAGLGVIRPYQRTIGDRLGRLMAPEGERCFALFTYAPGTPLYEGTLTTEQWREFGCGIARMHLEMDAFLTSHDRYHLDERILVERPLASLAPYAGSDRAAADLAELGKLGERLTGEIQRLRAIGGAYGIIHADLHRGNTNIDGAGRLVTFDFDHCGFGLRAYDLVALYRGPDSPQEDRERWAAVLAGYQQIRPLSQNEVAGFPVLAACRAMWDIGDWLGAAERTGDAWVTEAVIARLLADVRKQNHAADEEPQNESGEA